MARWMLGLEPPPVTGILLALSGSWLLRPNNAHLREHTIKKQPFTQRIEGQK